MLCLMFILKLVWIQVNSNTFTQVCESLNDQGFWVSNSVVAEGNWKLVGARRTFLDKFAKAKGFDPLLVAAWENYTSQDVFDVKVIIIIYLFYILFIFITNLYY
jgi:hypothetical protein